MRTFITDRLDAHTALLARISSDDQLLASINDVAALIVVSLRKGGKVLLCGNGGSATDAAHVAGELVGRFYKNRSALAAIALTVDPAVMTAVANDFGYETVFARQVEGLGRPGDILIGFSTSGESKNVVAAFEQATLQGIGVIAFTGENKSSTVATLADVCLCVPSCDTPRIQEAHMLIGHILCEWIERAMEHAGS